MNSSHDGDARLGRIVDLLLTESVSPDAVPEGTAAAVARKAQALVKPVFPLSRIAAVVAASAILALFAASNLDRFSWLLDLGSIRPFEDILASLVSIGFERVAALLAVTGGVVYTVYTIAFSRAK